MDITTPARYVYGRSKVVVNRNKPILSKYSFLAGKSNYTYLLRDYYGKDIDSPSGFIAGITDYDRYSDTSINFIKGKHKQIFLLPMFLFPLVYLISIELFIAMFLMSFLLSIVLYCLLNQKNNKLDQHFDLAFKHEDLIKKGLEVILQGKFIK
jgi:hypothetical protein